MKCGLALFVLATIGSAAANSLGDLNALKSKAQDAATCVKASLQLSCHSKYPIAYDSPAACCYNAALTQGGKESGLILSTQFWTTTAVDAENNGPAESTTIHGLWPDYCDGTYPQFCTAQTSIPEYTGDQIVAVLQKYDPALYGYYQRYFKDLNGDAPSFMEHEYNKHGTCYSTMRTTCQPQLPWISQADYAVLNYFRQIAYKFAERPTYSILLAAGIKPSATQTYALTDVQAALKRAHGATPYVGCNKNGEMTEFWYFWNLAGSVVTGGRYQAVESTTTSSCPTTLKYLPKP